MTRLKAEPTAQIQSMEELFAVAAAMEREAIDGYRALAERMREEGQDELVAVFERLVEEESRHMENVDGWSRRLTGSSPDEAALRWEPEAGFDDEGASRIAPELLSAYRAFSTAVRNEERAFAFWTYVAAHSKSEGLQRAAEQMAADELEHVATLRRERRRAFHQERCAGSPGSWTAANLEGRLAELLRAEPDQRPEYAEFSRLARQRASAQFGHPLPDLPLLRQLRSEASINLTSVTELLLDIYLEYGDRLPEEKDRVQAQQFAGELLHLLSALRQ